MLLMSHYSLRLVSPLFVSDLHKQIWQILSISVPSPDDMPHIIIHVLEHIHVKIWEFQT